MLHSSHFQPRVLLLGCVLALIPPSSGCACRDRASGPNAPQPIFSDAYSFYILDPGPFKIVGPDEPYPREFLILQAGEVELSCGRFAGALLPGGAKEQAVSEFARESMQSPEWLPGCFRWPLDAEQVTIGDRWYFANTVLVRRDADWTDRLSPLQRLTHTRELARFPVGADRIVRVYYTVRENDIYILTLSGSPEDVVVLEPDVRKLLAGVRLTAGEALEGTRSRPSGDS